MINILNGIEGTSSALAAQRLRMEVIAQNIANANTTRDLDGRPYQRQIVVFESVLKQKQASLDPASALNRQVEAARIMKDNRPFRMVPMPGHPDADARGMVAMPNVAIHEEMADLIVSSRAYEANLSVVRNARNMALQTLSIGKRS
ncbi:MAG TPA: flagellar basal body rod protein FlgC [Candidatus Paceibacterota bacterium]|nr:flagellar basal body rod protein FlgC [Verrucomicrobiota bacterium]HRY47465.1 flagellar basal body rod protein FlgC [Candidatus Paceibacterota bacterium]